MVAALWEPDYQGQPHAKGSTSRDSAGTVPGSTTWGLVSVPAEERLEGVSCGAGDPVGRDWPGGGHRGWCHARELQGLQPPSRHPPSEAGFSQAPPLAALAEWGGPAWGLCHPLFGLSLLQCTHPKMFLNEEPKGALLGPAGPGVSERTVRFQNMLVGWGRGVPDLPTALGLLGPRLSPAEAHADNKHRFLLSHPWLWSLPAVAACRQ